MNIVNKREWLYKAQYISLLYVFVIVFGLDHAQPTAEVTTGLEKCWSN